MAGAPRIARVSHTLRVPHGTCMHLPIGSSGVGLKSVPGRKSDASDCQWIQYLHSVGLLRASFHPPEAISAIRTLWRHRGSLLEMAAEHILHMQKALNQMNLQLQHVLSDITGTSANQMWRPHA